MSRGSYLSKKSHTSTWKTTCISRALRALTCLAGYDKLLLPYHHHGAQGLRSPIAAQASTRPLQNKLCEKEPRGAWWGPAKALLSCTSAQSSPKLDCSYVCAWSCTPATLWTLADRSCCLQPALKDCLGDGQLHPACCCCTVAFPELHPRPWFYGSGSRL